MIRLSDLSVGYHKETVVKDLSLTVKPGEIVTLIGPNGAGKSTILKTVCGALAPVAGGIYIGDRRMTDLSDAERARQIAVVLTEKKRTELLTCYDVVALGRYPYTGRLGVLSDEDRARIEEAMELTGVSEFADRDITTLSDGQRQRVYLAGAICQDTKVIVLDEPTSYLDIHHKLTLLLLLRKLAEERKLAVLMSMHEVELAVKISDRIVMVKEGAVQGIVSPDELADGDRIAELFNMSPELMEFFSFDFGKRGIDT